MCNKMILKDNSFSKRTCPENLSIDASQILISFQFIHISKSIDGQS